jgi:hypothetical protein
MEKSMLRRWYSGHTGSIAIWIITRMPGYPITGRGGMVNEMGIAVEAMQWAFVGLAAAIIVMELQRKRIDKRTASDIA